MKLYLSSQKLGNHPNQLIELCGENKKVVVIANALDDKDPDYRKNRVDIELCMLRELGLDAEEIDLREFFGRSLELGRCLETKSLVWLRGGSSFILRRAMIESGFDRVALPLITNNKLVYGGYSAALIMASKDLLGTALVDDPTVIPEGYSRTTAPTETMGLLDFYLIPHSGSRASWARKIPKHIKLLRDENYLVTVLKDGEVYIQDASSGKVWK